MSERDLSLPDADDDDVDVDPGEAVEQHRIRYNPSARPSRLQGAEGTRIRYNPSRAAGEDADV